MSNVSVPEEDLQAVEDARKRLYKYLDDEGFLDKKEFTLRAAVIGDITSAIWKVANKRYTPVV